MQNRYNSLLNNNLSNEKFTRQALALLEAQLREMALLILQDWTGTGIASSHSSHLLQAIGGLKHPAWGSWNFLIYTLRNLYHNNLEVVNSETLKKLEQATILDELLQILDSNVKA